MRRLVALYPVANVLALTGFLAAVLLLMGFEPPLTAALSLWFCFLGLFLVYLMGRKPLRQLGLQGWVAGLLLLVGVLALSLTLSIVR
jgi:hypothetical protein